MVASGNIFDDLPDAPGHGEVFETLFEAEGMRMERILSTGQTTAEDSWYDQPEDEWVVLLRGAARLLIEGEPRERDLGPGDWLLLPAHCRHRVTWTSTQETTVWLAVHHGRTSGPEA